MEEEKFSKKIFNNEEIDLETCDLEKLKKINEKLIKRKKELKDNL